MSTHRPTTSATIVVPTLRGTAILLVVTNLFLTNPLIITPHPLLPLSSNTFKKCEHRTFGRDLAQLEAFHVSQVVNHLLRFFVEGIILVLCKLAIHESLFGWFWTCCTDIRINRIRSSSSCSLAAWNSEVDFTFHLSLCLLPAPVPR